MADSIQPEMIRETEEGLQKNDFSSVVFFLNELARTCLNETKDLSENGAALSLIFACARSNDSRVEQAAAFLLLTLCETGAQEVLKKHPAFESVAEKLKNSPNAVAHVAAEAMLREQEKPQIRKKIVGPVLCA